MNKLLTVIAATLLAVTAIASGAEAGFNVRIKAPAGFSEMHKAGCGGGGGASRSYRRAAYQSVRRSKPRVEVASRTASKTAVVAKAETKAPVAAEPIEETENVAQIENSSITSEQKASEIKTPKIEKKVAEKPAKKAEQKVAAAGELGCKTFFASVGMTLSVPCAQK